LRIHFEPGTQYAYSGEGLLLAQFLIETLTGRPLETLMRERVFAPVGMSRTSMVWEPRFESDFAFGYNEGGQSLGAQRRTRADAAGSMQTTLHDFARLLAAVVRGDLPPAAMRERMLAPAIRIRSPHQFPTLAGGTTQANDGIRLSYGLGWGLYWTPFGKAFFKEGHDEGWRHYAVVFGEKRSSFLIMTNSSNGEGIFQELLETVFKNPYTPVEWEGFVRYQESMPRAVAPTPPIVVVAPAIRQQYVGRYGDPASAVLVVRLSGDHLSIQENDEPSQELFATSDTTFFSTVADDVFTFDLDPQGRVTRVVLRTGGQDISLKRLE
jgi:CubicO group peptidase (beta-lactamase class C family)